jgi:hypothetical protein
MIEKLEPKTAEIGTGMTTIRYDIKEMADKINEIVDGFNELKRDIQLMRADEIEAHKLSPQEVHELEVKDDKEDRYCRKCGDKES